MSRAAAAMSWALCFTVSLTPVHAARYASTPADLRRITLLLSDLSAKYRSAARDYDQRGPAEFFSHFDLPSSDGAQLRAKYFKGLPKLPVIEIVGGNTAVLRSSRGQTLSIEVVSFDDHALKFNGQIFIYDESAGVMATAEAIEKLLSTSAEQSAWNRFSPIREAHAEANVVVFTLAGMLGGVLVGALFKMWGKNKDSRQAADKAAPEPGTAGSPHAPTGGALPSAGLPSGTNPNAPSANASVEGISADIGDTVEKLKTKHGTNLPKLNQDVLDSVVSMGDKCGYDRRTANAGVKRIIGGYPKVDFNNPGNLHCSAYTYPIFADVVAKNMGTTLVPDAVKAIKVSQPENDGIGPYGYFNANGFGTATLFKETGIGENFQDIQKAMPGDFLKILWTSSPEGIVGVNLKKEKDGENGHSVIYLGSDDKEVCFASANERNNQRGEAGCGVRCEPKTNIRTMVFSRLKNLAPINEKFRADMTNDFLVKSAKETQPLQEALNKLGI